MDSPFASGVLAVVLALAACATAESVEEIGGAIHLGVEIQRIAEGRLTFVNPATGETRDVALVDLRELQFSRGVRISAVAARARVWTSDGSVLDGNLAAGKPGSLVVESRLFAPVEVPFESAVAVRLLPRGGDFTALPGFDEERLDRREAEDVAYVRAKDSWVRILGLIEAVTADTVRVSWEGVSRDIAAEKVGGLIFAAGGRQAAAAGGSARVRISGGSELVGAIASYDGETLTLRLTGGVLVPIQAGALDRAVFLTDRIAYLSDLEPAAFREASFFDRKWGYRTDRNVQGGPLSLGRVNYEKGLGVHSSASLEYALDGIASVGAATGAFESFSATIGLDDTASAMGSVSFRVLLDGVEVLAHEATAGAVARRIHVPLGPAKRLTLTVDFGADELDVGDVANWADAKLTR